MNYQPTSYVFSVKGFNSTDVAKAKISAESFSAIGLKLVQVEANKNEIVKDTEFRPYGIRVDLDENNLQ